ncbi:MAG: TPM domain-containing protein [Sulfurovaceae bacterium]|nr:TPM domain-containing protein [Sulfurovaceae bacterium]
MSLIKGLIGFILLIGTLYGEPNFPVLNNSRIVDEASLFDSNQKNILEEKLAAYELNSSNQIVVVTLKSLEGYDISDYGYQLGRHWGIGQTKKNNGVLLIIAPNEHKVRIEVGYGLEGALNDATANSIIQKDILPFFKAGNYFEGTSKGIDDIIKVTKGEYAPEQKDNTVKESSIFDFLMPILFLFIMISTIFFKRSTSAKSRIMPALVSGGIAGVISWAMFAIIPISIVIAVIIFLIVLFGHISPLNSYTSQSGNDFGGFGSNGGFGGFSGGGGSFGGGGASGSW